MQFTIATLVALAVSVAALPPSAGHKSSKISLAQASGQCQAGKIACCNPKKDISGEGVLGNLLAEGLLNNLLGTGDSACASQSLIKNLNLLGMSAHPPLKNLTNIETRIHRGGHRGHYLQERHCLLPHWKGRKFIIELSPVETQLIPL